MSKRKWIIVGILVLVLLIGGLVTMKIEDFLKNQKIENEQIVQEERKFNKKAENTIVEDISKNYSDIYEVTFTLVEKNNVASGYTYSFYVNDESYKKNQKYLWSYIILSNGEIGMSSPPDAGEYAEIKVNNSEYSSSIHRREQPLKNSNVEGIQVNYRLQVGE